MRVARYFHKDPLSECRILKSCDKKNTIAPFKQLNKEKRLVKFKRCLILHRNEIVLGKINNLRQQTSNNTAQSLFIVLFLW